MKPNELMEERLGRKGRQIMKNELNQATCSPFILGVKSAIKDAEGEVGDGGQNPFKPGYDFAAWMRGYYRVSELLEAEAGKESDGL